MEAAITIGILVFLVAVIVVVLLGPGGDGLRSESSFTKSFASWSVAGAASAGSGPINHSVGMACSSSLPMVSNDSAFKSKADAASGDSGRVVNQRFNSISHHSGPDHADAAPGVSNDLAAWGESRSEFDPLAFHHTDNFTL